MFQERAAFESSMLDLFFFFICWYLPFWGSKVKASCDDLEQQRGI